MMKKKIIISVIVILLLLTLGLILNRKQLAPKEILNNRWIYLEDNDYKGTFSLNREYEYYFHEDGSPIFGSDLCPTYNYKKGTVYLNCGFLKRDKIEIISYNKKELIIKLNDKEIKLITEKEYEKLQEEELNKYSDSKIYTEIMNTKFYRVINKKYEYLEIDNFGKLFYYYNSKNEDIINASPVFTFDVDTDTLKVGNTKVQFIKYENNNLEIKINNEILKFRRYDADFNYDQKYKNNKTYNQVKEIFWNYMIDNKNMQIVFGNDGSFYIIDTKNASSTEEYSTCNHYRFDSEYDVTILCEDKKDIKLKIHSVSDNELRFNLKGVDLIGKN